MKTKLPSLAIFLVALLLTACASIPKQATLLSEEIGTQINSIEQSHLNLLHIFFDEKRNHVDKFISETWIPKFAENFFNNETIANTWDQIVSSGNKDDRLKFIIMLGPKLQNKINDKRLELITPLDDLESTMEQAIRDEYNQVKSANNALTSYLYSASKVEENRERYLEMFGISENKINQALSDVDSFISKLVNTGETIAQKEKLAEEFLKKIEEVEEKLQNQ